MPNTDSSPTYTTDNAKRTLDDFSLNHPIEKISISAPSPVSSECSQISVSEPDSPPSHSTSPRSAPTEDNLDQLLAAIISKPRLSRAKTEKGSAPFWYGSEDTDHIRNIMAQYALQMGVDANRPKNSRCPLKFIGSIKRQAMEQPSNSTTFSTLDEVSIYVRDFFPLGHPLTAAQTQHVLVSWDREEGLPVKMQKLTESEYRRKQLVCTPSSATFLHCLPIFENSTDFSYSADKSPRSIGYHSSKADDLCLIQDIKVTKTQLQSESRQPDVFVEEFEEEDDTPEDPEINGLSPVDEELKDSPPRSAFALPCSIRDADLSDFEPSQIRFSVSIGFEFTASEPSAAPSKKKSPKANSSASAKDADADCMFPMDFEDSHNFSVTHIGFEFQSDSFDDEFDGADHADDNDEEDEEEEDPDSEQIDDSEEALEDFDFGFSFGPTASFHPPSLGRSQSQRSPARPIQSSKPASGSKGKGDDKKMSRSFEEELAGLMASFGGR